MHSTKQHAAPKDQRTSQKIVQNINSAANKLSYASAVTHIENDLIAQIRDQGPRSPYVRKAIQQWATQTNNGPLATPRHVTQRNELSRHIPVRITQEKLRVLSYIKAIITGFMSSTPHIFDNQKYPYTYASTQTYLEGLLATRKKHLRTNFENTLTETLRDNQKLFDFFTEMHLSPQELFNHAPSIEAIPEDHLLTQLSQPQIFWWVEANSERITAWQTSINSRSRNKELFESEKALRKLQKKFHHTSQPLNVERQSHKEKLDSTEKETHEENKCYLNQLSKSLNTLREEWEQLKNNPDDSTDIEINRKRIRENVMETYTNACASIASHKTRLKLLTVLQKLHTFHTSSPIEKMNTLIDGTVNQVTTLCIDSMDELRTHISNLILNLDELLQDSLMVSLSEYTPTTTKAEETRNIADPGEFYLNTDELTQLTQFLSKHIRNWLRPYLDALVAPNYATTRRHKVDPKLRSLLAEINKQLFTRTQKNNPKYYDQNSGITDSAADDYMAANAACSDLLDNPFVTQSRHLLSLSLLGRAKKLQPFKREMDPQEFHNLLQQGLPIHSRSKLLNTLLRYADTKREETQRGIEHKIEPLSASDESELFNLCLELILSGAKVEHKEEEVETLAYACERVHQYPAGTSAEQLNARWHLFLALRGIHSLNANTGWLTQCVNSMLAIVARYSSIPVSHYETRDRELLTQILQQIAISVFFGDIEPSQLEHSKLAWLLRTLWSYLNSQYHTSLICPEEMRPGYTPESKLKSLLRYYGTRTFYSRHVLALTGNRTPVDINALNDELIRLTREMLAHEIYQKANSARDKVVSQEPRDRIDALQSGTVIRYDGQIRDQKSRDEKNEWRREQEQELSKHIDKRLKEEREHQSRELNQMRTLILKTTARAKEAEQERDAFRGTINTLQAQAATSKEQAKKAIIRTTLGLKIKLHKQKEAADATIERLRAENATLKAHLTTAQSALHDEITTLRNENTALRDEVTTLRDESTTLRDEVTTLRDENTTLRDEVTTLRDENTTLRDEISALNANNTALHQTITDRDKCIESLKADLQSARSRIKELEEENARLRAAANNARGPSKQPPPPSGGSQKDPRLFGKKPENDQRTSTSNALPLE